MTRSADRYIAVGLPGEKGALAREEADLFALLPERAGPLSKLLKPTWDDADDPLCLVYSCVNDPDAPPSINTLYALKLLHVGLGIGADGDKRVTPEVSAASVVASSLCHLWPELPLVSGVVAESSKRSARG